MPGLSQILSCLTLALILVAPPASAQSYTNVTASAGLTGLYQPDFMNEIEVFWKMSGGMAVFDADGDGLDDILWMAGSLEPCRLYHNQGDGTFDLLAGTGLEIEAPITMPSFADYDDDGDLDLHLLTYQNYSFQGGPIEFRNFLFRNNGNLTFTDVATAAGLKTSGRWGASWGDLDGDGLIDLATVTWHPASLPGDIGTRMFRNEGDGTFTLMEPTGLGHDEPHGFSPTVIDYDGDGDQDVLSANDFASSRIWRNEGRWRFTLVDETIVEGGPLDDSNGMGSALGDINNDGYVDWFVTSILWSEPFQWGPATGNRMYVSAGDGTFTNPTEDLGLLDGGWGWGAQFLDVQNDARLDVAHVNGWYMLVLNPPNPAELEFDTLRIFVQQGDGTFVDEAVAMGVADTDQGRGFIVFDYDRDGLQDLLGSNNDGGLTLYRASNPDPGAFLEVRLRGTLSNSHGLGAKVSASHVDLPTQTRWITAGSNYLSQSPPAAWFGLADVTTRVTVRVDWPSGMVSFHQLDPNQHVVLEEPTFGVRAPEVEHH